MARKCVVCGEGLRKVYGYYCSMACAGADYVGSGEGWPDHSSLITRSTLENIGLTPISIASEVMAGLDVSGFSTYLWKSGRIL